MKSKELIKFCFLSSIVVLFISCSKTIFNNSWQNKISKAEVNSQNNGAPLRYYDDQSHLQYNVTNDSVNLYFMIRATDRQVQIKILSAGLQLWIDSIGKDKKQIGILFPVPGVEPDSSAKIEHTQNRPGTLQNQPSGINTVISRYETQPKIMRLVGFLPIEGLVPQFNEYGISATIDWDSKGMMNYVAVIPFKTFCKNFHFGTFSQKIFSVSFTCSGNRNQFQRNGNSGGRSDSSTNRMHNGSRSGMGGGGGGGMRGGMRGGGGGFGGGEGRQGNPGSFNQPIKIQMKVKLASMPH